MILLGVLRTSRASDLYLAKLFIQSTHFILVPIAQSYTKSRLADLLVVPTNLLKNVIFDLMKPKTSLKAGLGSPEEGTTHTEVAFVRRSLDR